MSLKAVAEQGGVRISVKVVPGASRDRIMGELGEALKIAVSKPPAEGAANAAVVELLCEVLLLPRGSVSILRGHRSPRKEILIRGLSVEQVVSKLVSG
ncbi:MAG TPA: DUF167 domain-containing protein [Tepidisphaeraceae bacterium]|jgi:hypothetical protein